VKDRRLHHQRTFCSRACAAILACSSALHAAEEPPAPAAPAPSGLLPIPDYSGDLWSRSHLTGAWGGTRDELARKGVQFDVSWTQAVQSVVDGGRDTGTRYGGSLDYNLAFDLMQMGLLPGALLKVRAESRYGESINARSGSILPVNTDAFFPLTKTLDEDIAIALTTLSYTQFLSEHFAVMLGKFDTLDGDPNEFASGRGTSQFMDANLNFNAALALRLPYSTLGGGLIWMPIPAGPDGGISVSSLLFATTDSSTTSGFGTFDEGLTWITEADFSYRLAGLPGGQNVGVLYAFDQDFLSLSGRLFFQPGQGLQVPTEDDTWAVFWSGWQYLVDLEPDAPLAARNTANGVPDRQGFGLFARVGFADEDTNPVEWSISGGIGGRGVAGRGNDCYGIGYYYTSVQTNRFTTAIGVRDHAQGFEAFYSLAITPAAALTFDVQVIDSVFAPIDTAVTLGARLRLVF